MLLHRLILKNFKRFRDQEIHFRDGITGIVGSNGAGKSTIVEALLFALYGVKGLGKNETEFIVSSFAGRKEKCEVRLDFATGGHDYTVLRTFKKTTASVQHEAQFFLGGSILADGVSAVEKEMVRVVGMGAEDFKNTIFAGQKDLLSLIDETPGERKSWFMRVLGLDFLKKETDAALKTLVQEKDRELRAYEIRMEELDREEIAARIKKCTDEIEHLKAEITALKTRQAEIHKRRQDLEEIRAELSHKKEQFISLMEQQKGKKEALATLIAEIERLDRELEGLKSVEQEFGELEADEERYQEVSRRFETFSQKKSRFEALQSNHEACETLIAQLNGQKTTLEDDLRRLEEDEDTCAHLEPVIRSRSALLGELEGLRAKEPHYYELWKQLERVKTRYSEIEQRVRAIREDIARLEADVAEIPDTGAMEERIRQLEQERSALISRVSTIAEQRRNNQNEKIELTAHLEELRNAGEEGVCPTCHRPLGDQYQTIIEEFWSQIRDRDGRENMLMGEAERAEHDKMHIEDQLARSREKLGQAVNVHASLDRLYKERTTLMRDAESGITLQGELEEQIAALGYRPERKREIEEEIERYESAWTTYLEARERLKTKDTMKKRLDDLSLDLQKKINGLDQIAADMNALGFEPALYAEVEAEFREREAAHRRFIELKARLDQVPGIEDHMKEKREAEGGIRQSIDEIGQRIAEIGNSSGELMAVERQLTEIGGEHETLMQSLATKGALMGSLDEKREVFMREQEMAEEYEAKITSLETEVALLKKTRETMGEYFMYLLHVVRDRIEGEVGRVLSEITDGRYENVLIDDNFTVLVNDMGGNYPAHRFSGGEQDAIAVALRIALSRYLAEMHQIHDSTFLIFDEIFGSQDEERRMNMLQALRTQEAHFPQIFLISHIADIQGEFANTLLVDMGENNESHVLELSP